MHGPAQRHIRQRGTEYEVRNATGSGSDLDMPNYSKTNTLVGTLEQRQRTPSVEGQSSGEDIDRELEVRAVYDTSQVTIREQGESDYPTILRHSSGRDYRVIATHPEDSGVTVIAVERA
jgi:hypothetical protein